MTALDRIKQIKAMQFFDDKRSIEQFMAGWEKRLWGNSADTVVPEIRANMLLEAFEIMGLTDKKAEVHV